MTSDGHEPGGELVEGAGRCEVELGEHDDGSRTALPRDHHLALDARGRQAVGGRRDQHDVEVRGQHLVLALGAAPRELRPSGNDLADDVTVERDPVADGQVGDREHALARDRRDATPAAFHADDAGRHEALIQQR